MTITDDLDAARSALQMIHAPPYNAEAPPEALTGEITPTALHYVRSNFALPAHNGGSRSVALSSGPPPSHSTISAPYRR